jgi:hypothetical protein
VNGEVPSNGALAALYGQQVRVSIRGRWTLIGVSYKLGRSPFVITERIPRSSDLLVVPHHDLGEKLAPQARQVFRSLDEVVRGLPRSSGLWIRSPGTFASRRGFWQGPLVRDLWDPGRWGPMGTHVSQH